MALSASELGGVTLLALTNAVTRAKSSHHSFAADFFLAIKRAITSNVASAVKEMVTPYKSDVRLW